MSASKDSFFLSSLKTAKKKDIEALANLLSPYIADAELTQPKVWGDKSRLHLERATIHINDLLVNTRSGDVTIEEDCFFGHRCMLLTGTHDYNKIGMERLRAVPGYGRDIIVKRGAWLGSGVTVLGPVTIGENAVVAAGSLVVKDVPENTIVAGRPAKPVKKITPNHNLEHSDDKFLEILNASNEVAFLSGFQRAKKHLSEGLVPLGDDANEFQDESLGESFYEASSVLVLGSKPGSYVPKGFDIAYGANNSFKFYDVSEVKRKVCVWGSLGLHILDDVLTSGVDEVVALGHEPKTFSAKKGRVEKKSGEGAIVYGVLSFFERRKLLEKVVGHVGPLVHDNFFLLGREFQKNLVSDALKFRGNGKDSLDGCYDWPLPWRPSAGIYALVLSILRHGKKANYVLAGIGCESRSSYYSGVGGDVFTISEQENNMISRYGIDAHMYADIEALMRLSFFYDISTTDAGLSEAAGIPLFEEC